MTELKADVLVVGGGAAACRAAYEAHQQGADVLMVVKGRFMKTGGTVRCRVTGISAAFGHTDPEDGPERHLEEILVAGAGMADEELARILAYEVLDEVRLMHSLGLRFEVESGGRFRQVVGCFARRARAIRGEDSIVDVLGRELKALGVPILEEVMVVDLLVEVGQVVGAVGLDRAGEVLVFRAGAVVLATGGAGQLYRYNFNTWELTGDGYAMGYRAGAELMNMEFMQMACTTLDHPAPDQRIYAAHPELYNTLGEEFLQHYVPSSLELDRLFDERARSFPFSTAYPWHYIDIAVQKEVLQGRGTTRLGVYIDLTRTPRERLKRLREQGVVLDRIYGPKVLKGPVEFTAFHHAFNGGLRINREAETRVKGLFAAGEVAAGPHGADRLGGNMHAACLVFGARAGRYAAQRTKKEGIGRLDPALVEPYRRALDAIVDREGEVEAQAVKEWLQKLMWQHALIVRNETGLRICLGEIGRLEAGFPKVSGRPDPFEALSLQNLLLVARMVCTAALRRRESRGSHYREDYQGRDDQAYGQPIIIRPEAPLAAPTQLGA